MQKLFYFLIGIIFLNSAEAQKHCKPGGFAFSVLTQPGTIPVDENAVAMKRHINKERFIYIMTSGGNMPTITSVAYGNISVKWSIRGTSEKVFSAITEKTQKTMDIKPAKGCSMWRIDIQEIPNQLILENVSAINIKGKTANKLFILLLNTETAVQGFDNY